MINTTLNLIKVVTTLSERMLCCLVADVALSEVVDMDSPCRNVWLWLTRRHGRNGLCPLSRIEPSTLRPQTWYRPFRARPFRYVRGLGFPAPEPVRSREPILPLQASNN
jgi:hypothetical protein